MDYVALNISTADSTEAEILTAFLSDWPFESFENEGRTLKAYIQQELLADCKEEVDAMLAEHGANGKYVAIESQNWNALWESNYPMVDVDGRMVIRAPFHPAAAEGVMEVTVMPKMAFGTGNHSTTWLIARALLDMDVTGREGLDMGSGTGVLSIVAVKRGAAHMDAVDIDDWAEANCRENMALNGITDAITPMLGDVGRIEGRRYDFIVANINRNILIAHMPAYAKALRMGGDLLLSGFLAEDVEMLVTCAERLGMHHVETRSREGWQMIWMRKS